MNIPEILKGPFYAHDGSKINEEGKRIGVVYITAEPKGAGKWIGEAFTYGEWSPGFITHGQALQVGNLFAAAPDLLTSAISAKTYMQRNCYFGDNKELTDAFNALSKAIDKATLPAPRYQHGAHYAECFYLGQMDQFDLYYQREFNNHTVIARYGDNDSDYHIGLNSPLVPLREAQQRAVDKGLI